MHFERPRQRQRNGLAWRSTKIPQLQRIAVTRHVLGQLHKLRVLEEEAWCLSNRAVKNSPLTFLAKQLIQFSASRMLTGSVAGCSTMLNAPSSSAIAITSSPTSRVTFPSRTNALEMSPNKFSGDLPDECREIHTSEPRCISLLFAHLLYLYLVVLACKRVNLPII